MLYMSLISEADLCKAAGLGKIRIPGLGSFLMNILKIHNFNRIIREANGLEGAEFADHILRVLGVKIKIDENGLSNIPKTGGFIAIANHPYGAIESLALLSSLSGPRPDALFMGNFLLKKIPNLEKCIIAVNPFEKIQDSSSISGLKITLNALKNGYPVAVFPAGEVSSYAIRNNRITDRTWHPVVGKIISKANVPVLPIYFHGNNGIFFSLLKMIHPTLQTAKLISELFNKDGYTLRITIGKPILIDELSLKKNPVALLSYLRKILYALKGNKEAL